MVSILVSSRLWHSKVVLILLHKEILKMIKILKTSRHITEECSKREQDYEHIRHTHQWTKGVNPWAVTYWLTKELEPERTVQLLREPPRISRNSVPSACGGPKVCATDMIALGMIITAANMSSQTKRRMPYKLNKIRLYPPQLRYNVQSGIFWELCWISADFPFVLTTQEENSNPWFLYSKRLSFQHLDH